MILNLNILFSDCQLIMLLSIYCFEHNLLKDMNLLFVKNNSATFYDTSKISHHIIVAETLIFTDPLLDLIGNINHNVTALQHNSVMLTPSLLTKQY